jgi:hypothetical protein
MAFCIVMIVILFTLHFDGAHFTIGNSVNSLESASYISRDKNYSFQVQESGKLSPPLPFLMRLYSMPNSYHSTKAIRS